MRTPSVTPAKTVDVRRIAGRPHTLAAVLLSLLLPGCLPEEGDLPSLTAVQAAYDSAKIESEKTHDDQLHIRWAACQKLGGEKVVCQISFTDRRSTSGRVFYDVVGLDRAGSGWRLVSGLCKG